MSLFGYTVGNNTIDSPRTFNGRQYPDPFVTYATMLMPRTIEDLLRWCEHLWNRNSTYAAAACRVVSYFVTKVEIQDCQDDDERKRYTKFLDQTLKLASNATAVGQDVMAYGNSFTSLYLPFRRFLSCNGCKCQIPVTNLDYKFVNFKFHWTCKGCKTNNVTERPIDRRTMEEDKVRIIRWAPLQIRIRHNPVSQRNEYLWDPPVMFKKSIRDGDPHMLQDTPWEIIEAIKVNRLFRFSPDAIYHMKEEGLAGINHAGWGVSRFMRNFTQAFHVQILKLYNEILAHEYIVPFRVISPKAAGGTGSDPMVQQNLSGFSSRMQGMLKSFRRSPGGWHIAPMPIEYQSLGAEGVEMATHELIEQAEDSMLNAAGFPAELYKGTLQLQALPAALRLFEQQWPHFRDGLDGWVRWIVTTLAATFNWEPVSARMQPPSLADDIETKQMKLQLVAANQLSRQAGLTPLGIDPEADEDQRLEEQQRLAEKSQKIQEEQQQKQMLQQQIQSQPMQAVGAGSGGADGASTTPQDMQGQADQIAKQLLSMPESQRRSELGKIRKSDETLWALVKSKMDQTRSEGESQGRQQMYQQMQAAAQQGQQ